MAITTLDPTQEASDFAARQERRKKAAELALQMGEEANKSASELESYKQQHLADMDKAGVAGRANIRASAAEGLAAAQAGGGAGGGSAYGALGQAGQTAGLQGAQFESGLAQQKSEFVTGMLDKAAQARQAGLGQQLEAQKFMAEQGSTTEDRQKRQAELDARVAKIIENNKGFFNDDEGTMYQQIMQLAATEDDSAMKTYLQTRANNIKNKTEDV